MNTMGKILTVMVSIFAISTLGYAQTDSGSQGRDPDSTAEEKLRNAQNENSMTTGTDNPNAAPAAAKQDKPAKKGEKEKKQKRQKQQKKAGAGTGADNTNTESNGQLLKTGSKGIETESAGHDTAKPIVNNVKAGQEQEPSLRDSGMKKSDDNATRDEN